MGKGQFGKVWGLRSGVPWFRVRRFGVHGFRVPWFGVLFGTIPGSPPRRLKNCMCLIKSHKELITFWAGVILGKFGVSGLGSFGLRSIGLRSLGVGSVTWGPWVSGPLVWGPFWYHPGVPPTPAQKLHVSNQIT